MPQKIENLDAKINIAGYEIAKILDENLINKLLGVLANDGVYAMWIYSKSKKDINENKFLEKLKDLLKADSQNYKKFFSELSNNLNQLLFFKELLEKTLTYARYHAKSMEN